MAAATNGEIIVRGFVPELIGSFLGFFNMMGGASERIDSDSMKFFKNVNFQENGAQVLLETGVFPILRTDLQPILAALGACSNLKTKVHDTVYNDRVKYIDVFRSFGINAIETSECFGSNCKFYNTNSMHSAIIEGNKDILKAPDKAIIPSSIRDGMAKIIIAAATKGQTVIKNVEIIERGYCSLFQKLASLGIKIQAVE
jgi:UDP-N-acetylglucosamine 1-carboxyvinyltransferase